MREEMRKRKKGRKWRRSKKEEKRKGRDRKGKERQDWREDVRLALPASAHPSEE